MKRKLILFYSSFIFANAYSQCSEAISSCEKLLQGGLYSFTGMTNTGSFNQDFRTYFLSEQFNTDRKNGKWGGSLTIPIKGVPISLGANDSEESFQEFRLKILSESTLNISSDFYQTAFSSIPNTNLYDAFNQCVTTICNENQVGFLPVKEIITEDYIVFTIHYRPQIVSDPMPKVEYFKVENAITISNPPQIGQKLNSTTIITAKRQPEKDIILTLQTDRGIVSRKIDGENSLSTNKEIPIGSVITSFLTFDEFNFASKNNVKSPGELWTAEKSKWAPCDGRSVNGSGYSKITSRNFVPDLRGMFIRGLNSFDPIKGPSLRSENERDPDNNRKIGDFQQDEFKKHNHTTNTKMFLHKTHFKKPTSPSEDLDPGNWAGYETVDTDFKGGEETRPKNIAVFYYIKIN